MSGNVVPFLKLWLHKQKPVRPLRTHRVEVCVFLMSVDIKQKDDDGYVLRLIQKEDSIKVYYQITKSSLPAV